MALVSQGGPSNSISREGSRTVVVSEQRDASVQPDLVPGGTLRLRGGLRDRPHVAWGEDVVDNEGLGRKKSKICCIYHKPREFDESSSSDSSGSESDGDEGTARPSGQYHHRHGHRHHVDREGDGGERGDKGGDNQGDRNRNNAYERMSTGKGKGKSS